MAIPANQVLETALKLIGGDRAADYGSMWENHENIAQLWNGYLYNKEGDLTAEDVANLMELMKIARRRITTLTAQAMQRWPLNAPRNNRTEVLCLTNCPSNC